MNVSVASFARLAAQAVQEAGDVREPEEAGSKAVVAVLPSSPARPLEKKETSSSEVDSDEFFTTRPRGRCQGKVCSPPRRPPKPMRRCASSGSSGDGKHPAEALGFVVLHLQQRVQALVGDKGDRLPGLPGSAQEVLAGGGAAHAADPSRRHAGLQVRAGRAAVGPPPIAGDRGPAAPRLGAGGRPRGPLPGLPGTGKTHLERRIVRGAAAGGRGRGAWGWARRPRTTGCAARCATAAASWVVEEVTQIDSDRGVRFLLLGDFLQLPAVLGDLAGGAAGEPPLRRPHLPAGCGWASPRRCPKKPAAKAKGK